MEKTGKFGDLSNITPTEAITAEPSIKSRASILSKMLYQVLRSTKRHVKSSIRTTLRNKRLYTLDISAAALALVFATAVRLGPSTFLWSGAYDALFVAIPAHLIMCALVFPFVGLYNRNWRYGSISDLAVIVRAVVTASLFSIGLLFFIMRLQEIPRSVILIDGLMLFSFLAAARLSFRMDEFSSFKSSFLQDSRRIENPIPILLVGVGDAADIYLRALRRDVNSSYVPVGLLDISSAQNGMVFRGIPVLGSLDDFEDVIEELKQIGRFPRHIVFTDSPAVFGEASSEILIQRAEKRGIAVSRLSQPTELRNSQAGNQFELKSIELTDLLERPQTSLDHSALQRLICGRRLVVTGAGGSIGSELTLQIASYEPAEIILLESCEYNLYAIDMVLSEKFPAVRRVSYLCDVRQMPRVTEIFERHLPELVFHAAALKHVPMVEINPCEGMMTNAIGTMNIANASKAVKSMAMVQISTDKVVNPTSVMGASKRVAELYCQALDLEGLANGAGPRFMTVRFGNVLGSSGSLIPLFKRQLARGGPLTVTDPQMTRFFMTVREAVELTLQASSYGLEKRLGQGEIFVLDMGKPLKVIDVARRMIRLAGYVPDKDINIKIIGCRPGEKLFEELFDSSEKRVISPVPGVLGAVPDPISLPVLRKVLAKIRENAEAGDERGLFKAVAELIPGYRKSSVLDMVSNDNAPAAALKVSIAVDMNHGIGNGLPA
jgi:FlaA1/EpsC-like NDP-sugar epimerase